MRKIMIGILAVLYLSVMAFFAFRPFKPIRGLQYAPADIEYEQGAVHVQRDAALEDRRNVDRVREVLSHSGQLSLDVVLQTDSLDQFGVANIFSLARNSMNRNFSLAQEGNALVFRLRTTETDHGCLRSSLVVPQVFEPNHKLHIAVTYDGEVTSLYVDGELFAESKELRGGFSNWDYDHLLVIGDLPPGGDGWAGRIWNITLYDRALNADEVGRLLRGKSVNGAVLTYDFGSVPVDPGSLRPLRYRNLFLVHDETAYSMGDCIFNIAGFVPLGMFVYLMLPLRMERRKLIAAVVLPAFVGALAGSTIEFLQQYILNRVPCAPDLVYNLTGALIGGLLAWLSFSTFKNNSTDGSAA